eukprot:11393996-Alexandrium_andersonii.AAC.1
MRKRGRGPHEAGLALAQAPGPRAEAAASFRFAARSANFVRPCSARRQPWVDAAVGRGREGCGPLRLTPEK